MNIEPKKILFIITQSELGGSQRFLYNLIENLDKSKYKLAIACGETVNDKWDLLNSLKESGITSFRISSLKRKLSPINDFRAIIEIRKIIKACEPDTIFLNSSKVGFLGSLSNQLIKNKKTKIIYRIGGWTFNDPWPKWKKNLFLRLEKCTARFKDTIIVNNKHDYEQAIRLGIKPKRNLVLIHNGIDLNKLNFLSKQEARIKIFEKVSKHYGKIFQTKKIIGTIANFYPTKGLKYLIQSAKRIIEKSAQPIAFILIGDGEQRAELEELIKQYELSKNVFLLGQIPEAYKYLPAFDIFVLPSIKEGFPWVALEAMAAKLPIITTKVGAIPEIFENQKNGIIIEPEDSKQISESIRKILESDILQQTLGLNAHLTVLSKFSSERMIKQIEELL